MYRKKDTTKKEIENVQKKRYKKISIKFTFLEIEKKTDKTKFD